MLDPICSSGSLPGARESEPRPKKKQKKSRSRSRRRGTKGKKRKENEWYRQRHPECFPPAGSGSRRDRRERPRIDDDDF